MLAAGLSVGLAAAEAGADTRAAATSGAATAQIMLPLCPLAAAT
jgi:hypothetical protein